MALESPNASSWEQRQVMGATLLAVVNDNKVYLGADT